LALIENKETQFDQSVDYSEDKKLQEDDSLETIGIDSEASI